MNEGDWMEALTWSCHICGEIRSDDKNSVYSTEVELEAGAWSALAELEGIKIKQNVRYCNDRAACTEGAKNVDWLRGPAQYEMTKGDI